MVAASERATKVNGQMRYQQSKERSAELLRAALAQMANHDAAFHPHTFAVWYEHLGGINRALTEALQASLRKNPRLDDEAVAHLYREHVAEIDAATVARASDAIQTVIANVATTAARTGSEAGAFGTQLSDLGHALQNPEAHGEALAQAVHRTLASTASMQEAANALSQQVEASQGEIDRLRKDLTRAREEALVDPLTQTINRRGFDRQLASLLALPPEAGRSHALVMFDIDRFKTVNDTYGHVMGDRLLQAVAATLQAGLTEPDLRMARYGGEEFALLLPNSSVAAASACAESLCARIRVMKVRDRRSQSVVLTVTVSAGVSLAQSDDDAAVFIARADAALYAAKAAGRDCVRSG